MAEITILWADDEIDLLKPHILFLEQKGYKVISVNNGDSAIEQARNRIFDIIFLDEQMPGVSGIEALVEIKSFRPDTPVIMITKSEAEDIMEAAIGSKISDYLIKPVNPNQILLSLKKNLNHKELISQKTTSVYQSEFTNLGMEISSASCWTEWKELYKKIVYWELELERSGEKAMDEVLRMQKNEANNGFCRFIKNEYEDWFSESNDETPLLSPQIVKEKVIPHIKNDETTVFLLIDNLRYDQWLILRPLIKELFKIEEDDLYSSILPTTTQYSRNSIFAGLMPDGIEKLYPNLWMNDEDEGGKNQHEQDLLEKQLKRYGFDFPIFFEKVTAVNAGKKLLDKANAIPSHKLSVIVYNFVDTLSHARTEMEIIKELASDEAAYRSITLSWFKHSPLFETLKILSRKKIKLILTTDHGSIRANNALKVIGDRDITTNLRYKQGKNLKYNKKEFYEIKKPSEVHLPSSHISSTYIFATKNDFIAYPNNYNHYVKYYKDTFQHGGISLEEMMIPIITLTSK